MKKLFVLFLLIPVLSFAQQPIFDTPLTGRIANYTIDVKFDPDKKTLDGNEKISWINKSENKIGELQFHLYWNAFRDENSTMMKEMGRTPDELKGIWGSCDIKKIILSDGTDLTDKIRFIQPDDGNSHDKTVASVLLPENIPPGGKIELKIEFELKIPPIIERAGYEENFYHFSQWFPKIGVYENGAWNCHQYHLLSEFYADFGVYDVSMTVPEKFKVGSSGIPVSRENLKNGLVKYRFHAEDVHDFAWTADDNFIEFNENFEGVKIRFMCQPDHAGMSERFIKAIKVTLDYFGKAYGKYPYPMVTCIDAQHRGAVMEYPTLFLTGNFPSVNSINYISAPVPEDDLYPEMLTIHEFGHNWWYGMIANNEFEYAWIDEGFVVFATTKALEYGYGKKYYTSPDGRIMTIRDYDRYAFKRFTGEGIIDRPSWEFKNIMEYYGTVYKKVDMMLLTFDNYFGDKKWGAVVKDFFRTWQFRHPKTEDFLDIFQKHIGHEFDEFLNLYLNTPFKLDYIIGEITGKSITLLKEGKLFFPVKIKCTFADGSYLVKDWDGKGKEYKFDYLLSESSDNSVTGRRTGSRPKLVKVEIDPDNIIEFEQSKINNIRLVK